MQRRTASSSSSSAVALTAWALAQGATAQPAPDLPVIEAGTTVERPALSGGRSVDVFQLRGAVGARLTADVAGIGPFTATLYAPEGVPMLTTTGSSGLKLVAFLPVDGTYRLSIAREDSTRPYSLALASEAVPDILTANIRQTIGYEADTVAGPQRIRRCWIEPGVKFRVTGVDPEFTVTDLGGGVTRSEYLIKGKPQAQVATRRMDGDEMVTTVSSLKMTFRGKATRPPGNPIYKGYFCDPPPAVTPAPLTPLTPPPAVSMTAKADPAPTPLPAKRAASRPPFAPPVFVK